MTIGTVLQRNETTGSVWDEVVVSQQTRTWDDRIVAVTIVPTRGVEEPILCTPDALRQVYGRAVRHRCPAPQRRLERERRHPDRTAVAA